MKIEHGGGKLRTEMPIHREIAEMDGWWVPAQTGGSLGRWLASAKTHIDAACAHVRGFDLAVQAGAHIGAWGALLAERFGKVHCFEPDPNNERCARLNLDKLDNVSLHTVALGNGVAVLPWSRSLSNSGKMKIDVLGRGKGRSSIKDTVSVTPLDCLGLHACDLICLDVEGYELPALQGAEHTVERFRPVILVEDLPHAKWHGLPLDGVRNWMAGRGYREAERIDDDVIWVPT